THSNGAMHRRRTSSSPLPPNTPDTRKNLPLQSLELRHRLELFLTKWDRDDDSVAATSVLPRLMSRRFRFSPLPRLSLLAKIPNPRQIQHLRRQFQFAAVEAADVAGAFDQVARLAGAELAVLGSIPLPQDGVLALLESGIMGRGPRGRRHECHSH